MEALKVAVINWHIDAAEPGGSPVAPMSEAVRTAARAGAQLVLLPESCVLELLRGVPGLPDSESAAYLAPGFDDWCQTFSTVARETGAIVIAGSGFEQTGTGIQNVAPLCLPDGRVLRAVKNRLTTYEREVWNLTPGQGQLALNDPPIGVSICYDSEFPEGVRSLAEAGVQVLCVPAFTEGRRGFQRVRWCAQARAVENQIFVLHSSLVGGFGREPMPSAFGSSAILCPSHEPFPESAILDETQLNAFGIASATLDFEALRESREGGDVRNWHDRLPAEWPVISEA